MKERWIFLYGFQKNERENISHKELGLMVGSGKLLEVIYGEKE
jgi:hypothetical protein